LEEPGILEETVNRNDTWVFQYDPETELHGRVVDTLASYSGVPGSNLDQETGYSDLGGRGFFQFLQPNARRVP
jgi:hypothetical protein